MPTERRRRSFDAKPARRGQSPVLVGLAGPSSCGKTHSMLRIAQGIAEVTGESIAVIDTEACRSLEYAPAEGEQADGINTFDFQHIPLEEPFGSLDYRDAIAYAKTLGAGVICIDSMSHEHEGPGGLLDYKEKEQERLGGGQNVAMLAWQAPKSARRALLTEIVQGGGHYVFCFRAKDTSKPNPDPKAPRDKKVLHMGFTPITDDQFTFEMTIHAFLPPNSGGVPDWNPEFPGERKCVKTGWWNQDFLRNHKGPLDENVGRFLAEWKRGGVQSAAGRQVLLKQIPAMLKERGLAGKDGESKAARGEVLVDAFGTSNWNDIQAMAPERLEAGIAKLKETRP